MRHAAQVVLLLTAPLCAQVPAIAVLEPNGGERYSVGDTMHISWSTDGNVPLSMVEMSVNGGERYYGIYTSGIGVDSSNHADTTWVVTDSLRDATSAVSTRSSQCLIRVRDYVTQIAEDASDAPFSVGMPPPADGSDDGCGCGSGAGAAFIPPLFFKLGRMMRRRRRTDG